MSKHSSKIDMLNGPLWNKLPLFALPVAATAILEQLFNAADLAVIGNFASGDKTAAVAAIGANSPVTWLRHFSSARHSDHHRSMRHKNYMDLYHFPQVSDL